MAEFKKITTSVQETMALAKAIAGQLKAGDIILLNGPLGAGKTTFTKGLAEGFRIKPAQVNSPTFILMNFYEGRLPIYHFDFYRLERAVDVATVDMDEYFYGQGITVIEWPERLGDLKPREYIQIDIAHQDETKRSFSFFAAGDNYRKRLKMILDKIL